jgi:hypothetical protein
MGQISIIKDIEGTQPTLSPDNYFVVSATTNEDFNFRYVYDLYVFNEKVFTGKLTPNPEGLGIIPVGEIIHDYARNAPIAFSATTGGGGSSLFVHQTEYFTTPQLNEVVNWWVNFGEEHSSTISSQPIGYSGIETDTGEPAYPSGLQRSFLGTMGRNIFSNLPKLDTDKFFMTGYDGTFPSYQSLFLTNSPRIRDIGENDYFTLSALNYILPSEAKPNGDYSYVYDCEYNFYDTEGALISGYTTSNTREYGGGPRDTCDENYENYSLPTNETQDYWNIIHIAAGTKNLFIPSGTKYYTLQLRGVASPPPPTPTPTTLPEGYTSWRLRSCCNPENTILAGIQSGYTGSVRVYNNNCYYADEQITGASILIAGGATHANCDACKSQYPCGAQPTKGENYPTPTPTYDPSSPPSGDRSSCPDWDYSSEIFQFNIVDDCDNPYDTNQFLFKNRYGTWDYFKFNKKKIEQIEIERERYNQFDINYGSSNPVKEPYARGLTDYSTQMREIHTYNTGFINEPDMYYLEELFTSNDVYMILDNGVPFPINIISNTFDKKTKGRGKELTNITIQFEFANNIKLLDK